MINIKWMKNIKNNEKMIEKIIKGNIIEII